MSPEKWFHLAWLMNGVLFPAAWSPAAMLILMVLRCSRRDGGARRELFSLPADRPLVRVWQLFLLAMVAASIFALDRISAVSTTAGFALASYFGLSAAPHFSRNEDWVRNYVVIPLATAVGLISANLVALRLFGMYRATLFGLNENLMGTLLLLGVGLSLAYLDTSARAGRLRMTAFLILVGLGIFSTGSRGALIGLGVLVLARVFHEPRRFVWAAAIMALITGLIFSGVIPMRLQPDLGRVRLWNTSLELIRERPWFGIGANNFFAVTEELARNDPSIATSSHAHNLFLQVALDSGLIGLVLFVALLGLVAHRSIRVLRLRPDPIARGLNVTLLSLLVREMVDVHLFYVMAVDIYVWLVIGLIAERYRAAMRDESPMAAAAATPARAARPESATQS